MAALNRNIAQCFLSNGHILSFHQETLSFTARTGFTVQLLQPRPPDKIVHKFNV